MPGTTSPSAPLASDRPVEPPVPDAQVAAAAAALGLELSPVTVLVLDRLTDAAPVEAVDL